jgi:hypothetical protein
LVRLALKSPRQLRLAMSSVASSLRIHLRHDHGAWRAGRDLAASGTAIISPALGFDHRA